MLDQELASRFVEIIPRSMGSIRFEVRRHIPKGMSVTQFRLLNQIKCGSTTPSELAEQIGVSLPAISRLIDPLVKQKWIIRKRSELDRRQVTVELSKLGQRKIENLLGLARKNFSDKLCHLTLEEKKGLSEGLKLLERIALIANEGEV